MGGLSLGKELNPVWSAPVHFTLLSPASILTNKSDSFYML